MDLCSFIDHTLLNAYASYADIEQLCRQASEYNFYSVCVNPCNVYQASGLLDGSGVKVCTVIGFPLGADTYKSKCFQACTAFEQGSHEVDMVINIGAVKGKDYRVVEREITEVKKTAGGGLLKVILETCYLTDQEKVEVATLAAGAGADFVKTSTGFGTGGATAEDVKLLRKTVGNSIGVKASGGIRDLSTFMDMVNAGANRIGTSSGVSIVQEWKGIRRIEKEGH